MRENITRRSEKSKREKEYLRKKTIFVREIFLIIFFLFINLNLRHCLKKSSLDYLNQ